MTTSTEPTEASSPSPSLPQAPAPGIAARIARSNILDLEPYRCARDDYSEGILLDANENAYGPAVPAEDGQEVVLERYPDPYQVPLKLKLAAYRGHGLEPSNIFVGVGSDEAIDLLMRIFCRPGIDKILQTPPTYGMYKVCAKVNDVDVVNVPLTPDFDLRIQPTLDAITPQVKLLFLCSPGNPTAKAIPIEDVEAVVGSPQARDVLVVVDEAYVDFSTRGSAASLIGRYPNVAVLQTLSKAFGLAAIRCGFCLGPPDVIRLMNNVKAPYNVNALTSRVALDALDRRTASEDLLSKHVASLLEQRERVASALGKLPFVAKVFPSDSNFVLFRLRSKAKETYKAMADGGVVTRYRGTEIHCDECIRVTIGTPEENAAFLEALVGAYNAL
jgi:histidinol-phosphate aminotransferase